MRGSEWQNRQGGINTLPLSKCGLLGLHFLRGLTCNNFSWELTCFWPTAVWMTASYPPKSRNTGNRNFLAKYTFLGGQVNHSLCVLFIYFPSKSWRGQGSAVQGQFGTFWGISKKLLLLWLQRRNSWVYLGIFMALLWREGLSIRITHRGTTTEPPEKSRPTPWPTTRKKPVETTEITGRESTLGSSGKG